MSSSPTCVALRMGSDVRYPSIISNKEEATKMRSIYYRTNINVLDNMRREGRNIGNLDFRSVNEQISRVIFYGESNISSLKRDSMAYATAWFPDVRLVEIDEPDFLRFLVDLGANNDWWMLRFWDIRPDERIERAISVGREHANYYTNVLEMLETTTRLHHWAGVEVTPPEGVRVGLYRYPTASISVRYGNEHDPRYLSIEERWEDFLRSLNLSP